MFVGLKLLIAVDIIEVFDYGVDMIDVFDWC